MITVNVTYYAMLKEQCGCAMETVRTEARQPDALYDELQARYGFRFPKGRLKVARNDEFVTWSTTLEEGDRIAFIPPVAGG